MSDQLRGCINLALVSALLPMSGVLIAPTAIAQTQEMVIEEIVVTAQRREESLQEVPISISAFDANTIESKQIENFSDLQFASPNISYSKTQFTSSSFQIRGLGSLATGASTDGSVGVHLNDVPLYASRQYELEYFDLERIEILRGPQGTLFGRNATGGVVNMITAKPTNEFGAFLELEAGDYDSRKAKAWINIPMGDTFSARIAGLTTKRDGYTENLVTGNDIDGRDSTSLRGSLRWQPTDRTTVDFMVSWFDEDSNRSRAQKQLCNADPVGNYGCLPDALGFGLPNSNSELANIVVTDLVLEALAPGAGVLALQPFGLNQNNQLVPTDLRQVAIDFEPQYKADETLFNLALNHEFEYSTLTVSLAHQETSVWSRTDSDQKVGQPLAVPAAFPFLFPTTAGALYADGSFPVSQFNDTDLGVIGGYVLQSANALLAYDESASEGEQSTVEVRLASDFDGAWNFLLGGLYFDYESGVDYFVGTNTFDYFSLIAAGVDGIGIPSPYFTSRSDFFGLKSTGFFGELYFQPSETVRVTLGLRHTTDEKDLRDRSTLLAGAPTIIGTPQPSPGTFAPYREASVEFSEMTGRLVVDWAPSDDVMVYGSYSRGYKGGGINPPFDPVVFPNLTEEFQPEFIDAFEIGMKSTLADGRLQANMSAFWYDYQDLQVTRIQNRTAFNDNIDADVFGLEGEFIFAPTDRFVANLGISYLNTEIGDVSVLDTRDPTNGQAGTTLVKDIGNASNCVLLWNGGPDPATTLPLVDPLFGLLPFSSCDALAAVPYGLLGLPYSYSDGLEANIAGNALPNSPELSVSLGAQYDFPLGDAYTLSVRGDYYWQDESYSRIFNKSIDRIDSWDVINAQVTLEPVEGRWYLRGFVQNAADDDNITGMYVGDPALGLITNVFTIEPRRYGVVFGIHFD